MRPVVIQDFDVSKELHVVHYSGLESWERGSPDKNESVYTNSLSSERLWGLPEPGSCHVLWRKLECRKMSANLYLLSPCSLPMSIRTTRELWEARHSKRLVCMVTPCDSKVSGMSQQMLEKFPISQMLFHIALLKSPTEVRAVGFSHWFQVTLWLK